MKVFLYKFATFDVFIFLEVIAEEISPTYNVGKKVNNKQMLK